MKNLLTTLRFFAALIIVLIINDGVYSQNVISSVSTANKVSVLSEKLATSNANVIDVNKEAENWMSNKTYLDISSSNFSLMVMRTLNEEFVEYDRALEDWMFNNTEWELPIPDEEDNILEEWMFDSYFWQIKNEEESIIEDWMIDDEFWVMVD